MNDVPESVYHSLLSMDLLLPRDILLNNLRENVVKLHQVKVEIQVYPIGFLRLPFTKDRLHDGFALHVWKNDLPWRDSFNLHTHIFNMRSRVLRGAIIDTEWDVVENLKGEYRLTKPYYQDGRMVLEELGRVNIRPNLPDKHTQDEVYEVPKHQFHSSEVEEGTVTLIEKSEINPNDHPLVVLQLNEPTQEGGFDSTQFPQDQAWAIIERSMSIL